MNRSFSLIPGSFHLTENERLRGRKTGASGRSRGSYRAITACVSDYQRVSDSELNAFEASSQSVPGSFLAPFRPPPGYGDAGHQSRRRLLDDDPRDCWRERSYRLRLRMRSWWVSRRAPSRAGSPVFG